MPAVRPLRGGGEARLLHGVLSVGEVSVLPRDRREHLRRKIAQ